MPQVPTQLTAGLFVFLLMLLGTAQPTKGQQMRRARAVMTELSSPYYFGRGYLKDGHKKAANYLKETFERAGLEPVQGSYYQPFALDIVQIHELNLRINGQRLRPGLDFIAAPHSYSGKGQTTAFFLQDSLAGLEKICEKKNQRKALIANDSLFTELFKASPQTMKQAGCAEVWLELHKETPIATMANYQFAPPWFKVVESALPVPAAEIQTVEFELLAQLEQNVRSQNVWGKLQGQDTTSFLMISAHYDHLGGQGDSAFFPGANDNATGVAMMLELMHHFKARKQPLKHTLLFVAFGGEEAGLQGSKYSSEHFPYPLEDLHFLLNIDLMSTGDIGLTAVNAPCCPAAFALLDSLNETGDYVGRIKKRGQAANSDHYHFNQAGVPGFFLYTEGEQKTYYHNVYDTAPTLPLTRFEEVFRLLSEYIAHLDGQP